MKEGQWQTFVRASMPFKPRKSFTPIELQPCTPVLTPLGKSGRDIRVEQEVDGKGKRRMGFGGGILVGHEGVRSRGVMVGLKIGVVLWEVGIGGVETALEERSFVVCEGGHWLVDVREVDRRKKLGKMSSTVVDFVRGLEEARGLIKRGLWLSGQWYSVRCYEAVQPSRKKSGWVWVKEVEEGLVKTEWLAEKELSEKMDVYLGEVRGVRGTVDGEAMRREIRRVERWARHEGLKWTTDDERKEEEESNEDADVKRLFGGVDCGSSGGLLSGFGGGAKKVVSGWAGGHTASSSTCGGMQREVVRERETRWFCNACDGPAWSVKGKTPRYRGCNEASRVVEEWYWIGPKD